MRKLFVLIYQHKLMYNLNILIMGNRLENVFEKTKLPIKNWWVMLISGILLFALGVVVFFFPGESYLTLAIWFGVLMLAGGIAELIVALSNRSFFINRGWTIASGVINILLGIILCCNPSISALMLPLLLGFWMMNYSFIMIGFGGDLSGLHIAGSGWTIAGGILLMLLSFCIIFFPVRLGIPFVVILIGISLIITGIMLYAMSLKLRNIHKEFNDYYTDYKEVK